jgi:hypothetical protein
MRIGDRVQWRQRDPVTCITSPCDRTPGMVVGISQAPVGELRGGFVVGNSGLVVHVQHEESPFSPVEWPAESLLIMNRHGRTTREYLQSINVPETQDQAWIVDQTRMIRALRKERGEPAPGCLDAPWTPEEEAEVAQRLQTHGISKPTDPNAPAAWASEITPTPSPSPHVRTKVHAHAHAPSTLPASTPGAPEHPSTSAAIAAGLGGCQPLRGRYVFTEPRCNIQVRGRWPHEGSMKLHYEPGDEVGIGGGAQGLLPTEDFNSGIALAVGLGAIGLVGLGMYLLDRKSVLVSKFGAAEYTIGLEGSAFDPRASRYREELEREGFEVTGFGTAHVNGSAMPLGDIDVLGPRDEVFDQEKASTESRRLFRLGQKHGLNVQYVSSGPSGELSATEEPCIPCGDDSGWEVVKPDGDVSLPFHNKGDAESDARLNGGKVRPLARFSDSEKLKKVYRS